MKSIKEIIDNFNFEKVRAYMILTNWTYRGAKEIPSIETLKALARSHLINVYNKIFAEQKEFYYFSGSDCIFHCGFKAYYCPYNKELYLEFVIERSL